jgi:hypothetical protein
MPTNTNETTTARKQASLNSILDNRLLGYAAAATAALLSQSAQAKVVYTSANLNIPLNTLVALDLNNDGTKDFQFYFGFVQDARKHPEGQFSSWLDIYPGTGNSVWAAQTAKFVCAAALPAGVKVGQGRPFNGDYLPLWQKFGNYTQGASERCPWAGRHHGAFLGLKFYINRELHYGWAHVTVGSTTVLDGYAYETIPNQAIDTGNTGAPGSISELENTRLRVPQPATLGALAQGERGLSIWRREEEHRQA